jgi:hypothetical protein
MIKIKYKRKDTFGSLPSGASFCLPGSQELYMKIPNVTRFKNVPVNTFVVSECSLIHFEDDVPVTMVNIDINIK